MSDEQNSPSDGAKNLETEDPTNQTSGETTHTTLNPAQLTSYPHPPESGGQSYSQTRADLLPGTEVEHFFNNLDNRTAPPVGHPIPQSLMSYEEQNGLASLTNAQHPGAAYSKTHYTMPDFYKQSNMFGVPTSTPLLTHAYPAVNR